MNVRVFTFAVARKLYPFYRVKYAQRKHFIDQTLTTARHALFTGFLLFFIIIVLRTISRNVIRSIYFLISRPPSPSTHLTPHRSCEVSNGLLVNSPPSQQFYLINVFQTNFAHFRFRFFFETKFHFRTLARKHLFESGRFSWVSSFLLKQLIWPVTLVNIAFTLFKTIIEPMIYTNVDYCL